MADELPGQDRTHMKCCIGHPLSSDLAVYCLSFLSINKLMFAAYMIMEDLNKVGREKQTEFFDSFDHVFVDLDGVLWTATKPVPNAALGIHVLRKIGKTVITASNNTISPPEALQQKLKLNGFDFDLEHITSPVPGMVSYLKNINFDKEIFVLGEDNLKKSLSEAGFKLAANSHIFPIPNLKSFAEYSQPVSTNIGAVVFDLDYNLSYLSLQRAANYLSLPDTLLLTGVADKIGLLPPKFTALGPGFFVDILEKVFEKKAINLAKPSKYYGDYLVDAYNIEDRSKVLFIGDSIESDMGLAANSGFKKLLVLSGITKKSDIENWSYPEELKPDFYVDSLGTVYDIIKQLPEYTNLEN